MSGAPPSKDEKEGHLKFSVLRELCLSTVNCKPECPVPHAAKNQASMEVLCVSPWPFVCLVGVHKTLLIHVRSSNAALRIEAIALHNVGGGGRLYPHREIVTRAEARRLMWSL